MDSKGVFTDGLNDLHIRLNERFYTSVQAFIEDMAAVLSAGIGFVPIVTGGEVDQESNRAAQSTMTLEQKETKKLVKRIMKILQPLFEEALHKEADLAGRPYEKLPDLEALFNQQLQRRSSNISFTEGDIRQTTETDQASSEQDPGHLTNGKGEAIGAKSDEMQLAPTPDDNPADAHHSMHDEATDEAAIAAQLGRDAMHASAEGPQTEAMEVDQRGLNGQTLTPPRSEKNSQNPLAHGGIPWYLETFDIHGTTVYEERYTGREVLRDMSEELSELDDDVLDGLADSDPIRPVDVPDANAAAIRKAAARKKARRSRGW